MKFSACMCICRGFSDYNLVAFGAQVTKVISINHEWGNFRTNFQSPLAAKLLIGSEKIMGCKNADLCHHDKFCGDHTSHASCRRKSMFVCHASNHGVCENRNGINF